MITWTDIAVLPAARDRFVAYAEPMLDGELIPAGSVPARDGYRLASAFANDAATAVAECERRKAIVEREIAA